MLKARCHPLRLPPRQRQQSGSEHDQNRCDDDERQDDEAAQHQDRWPGDRSPAAQLLKTPHDPTVDARRDSSDVESGTVSSGQRPQSLACEVRVGRPPPLVLLKRLVDGQLDVPVVLVRRGAEDRLAVRV